MSGLSRCRAGRQGRRARVMARVVAAALLTAGCTKAQLDGRSSAYAVLDELTAASGATPATFGGALASDVLTYVRKTRENQQVCEPARFADHARATFHLALRDPGGGDTPTTPTAANAITFTRYRVEFVRADGRNVAGTDVPYAFDGGLTMTVAGGEVSMAELTIVRAQAKEEAPLKNLVGGGGAGTIATIARVTFYGTDAAGRPVRTEGGLDVDFSDWSDPEC